MKRICHIITRFVKGGADENTLLTVERLDKQSYDVTLVIGTEYEHSMVQRVKNAGVHVHIIPLRHFQVFSAVRSVGALVHLFRRERFDMVHTHETEAGIVGRFAARLAGVPTIIHTVHGSPFSKYRSPFLNVFVLWCERLCARFTTQFIVNADIIMQEYLQRGIGRVVQYTTIYSGIELQRFKAKKTSGRKPPVITIIGRLARGKGHETFLRAAQQVLKSTHAEFWIVGEGEHRHVIEKLRNDLQLKAVKFLGRRDDIPAVLAQSSIVVVPSLWEGTPRVIPEAMAAGVPVIASAVGGIPEQIQDGENGILIPANNPPALAEKILSVISNPAVARKLSAAGSVHAKRFSAYTMVDNIDKLYNCVIK